jgi:hypothetical protein
MNRKDVKSGKKYYLLKLNGYSMSLFYELECVEESGSYAYNPRFKVLNNFSGYGSSEPGDLASFRVNNLYFNFKTVINKIVNASKGGAYDFGKADIRCTDKQLIKSLFTHAKLKGS